MDASNDIYEQELKINDELNTHQAQDINNDEIDLGYVLDIP